MDFAIHSENFLSAWNLDVVQTLKAEVSETGSERSAGSQSKPRAGSAAVQIQRQDGAPARDFRLTGIQDALDVRIAGKNGSESWLYHHRDSKIRTGLLQQRERGSGQHRISQRAQSNDSNPRIGGEALEHGTHFDSGALILRSSLRRSA
jgi:hypothetical protein